MSDSTMERKMLHYTPRGSNLSPKRERDAEWFGDSDDDRIESRFSGWDDDPVSAKMDRRIDVPSSPRYPRQLLIAFVVSGILTVIVIIALVFSPLYASEREVTILFGIAALSGGVLSIVLKRAGRAKNP